MKCLEFPGTPDKIFEDCFLYIYWYVEDKDLLFKWLEFSNYKNDIMQLWHVRDHKQIKFLKMGCKNVFFQKTILHNFL